ncbi:MAG: hypothetical protein NWE81_03285, partial [Candidatus Bathyarchaeota archaeon]|nr:hypothetical protein [Candidatus Bathyarchaeota archaeon]
MADIVGICEKDISTPEKRREHTVSVIECGVTGLSYAVLLAEAGFRVIGVSPNPHSLRLLKRGKKPFGGKRCLALEKHVKGGDIVILSDARRAVHESDTVIIAVETEIGRKNEPDYSLLERTCKEVGIRLRRGSLIIFASRTTPGMVEGQMREILENASGLAAGDDFGLASMVLHPLSKQSRDSSAAYSGIIGAINEQSLTNVTALLSQTKRLKILTASNIRTIEATRLFQHLGSEISLALANELALLCEKLKVDFFEILNLVNATAPFHLPLPGVTSHLTRAELCLLTEKAENVDSQVRLMILARRINDEIVEHTFRLLKDALKVCGKTVRRAKVSVLGISGSPNCKEAPSVLTKDVITRLRRKVKLVQVYDPFFSKSELAGFGFETGTMTKVVKGADCVVVLT